MVEIKQLAVIVKKKKKSSSLLKQRSAYLLSNYSANQGNHTSFKMITNRYFPLQFMEGFCMKGIHLDKACNVQWKQLLSYFSTSHESGWGIFLSWSANHPITVWTDLKHGNCYDHQVHYICWCSHHRQIDVLLFWVLKTNCLTSLWEYGGGC